MRKAQKWQPIPHCPPHRAGRSPSHTVCVPRPGPQDVWACEATVFHFFWKRRNLTRERKTHRANLQRGGKRGRPMPCAEKLMLRS